MPYRDQDKMCVVHDAVKFEIDLMNPIYEPAMANITAGMKCDSMVIGEYLVRIGPVVSHWCSFTIDSWALLTGNPSIVGEPDSVCDWVQNESWL